MVLEFDCSAVPDGAWARVRDTATMWEEREVAFYRTERLRLVAVWRLGRSGWGGVLI